MSCEPANQSDCRPSLEERIAQAVEERLTPLLRKLEEALIQHEKYGFTSAEADIFIACSAKHIRAHVTGGTLPVSNIGTNDGPDYRISRPDLIAWLEKRKAGVSPPPRKKKKPQVDKLPFSPHRRLTTNAV